MSKMVMYRIILKHLALILVFMLLTGSAVALLSWFVMRDEYQASATIIVGSQASSQDTGVITNEDYTLNVKLVNSYLVLCKTERVLSQVIEKTGLPLTVKDLKSKITVSSEINTEIFNITVTDHDPAVAQNITNSLADVFQKEVVAIMKVDNVQIIDYAGLPTEPIAPNRVLNTVLATIAGFFLGAGFSVLLEYFNTKVKTVEQAEAIVGAPVLGCIPHIEQ